MEEKRCGKSPLLVEHEYIAKDGKPGKVIVDEVFFAQLCNELNELRAKLKDVENSDTPVGKILDNRHQLFYKRYVGSGGFIVNGIRIQLPLYVGAVSSTPMLEYGNRTFLLDWKSIIELAEKAGLFKDEVPA